MKYDKFLLYSHQRSGSHYICALIAKNFFKTDKYLQFYRNHPWGDSVEGEIVANPDKLFVYTWRDMEPCLRSIYKLRKRFGLDVDDYTIFKDTKYCDMWTDQGPRERVMFNYLDRQGFEEDISYFFRTIEMTPVHYWRESKIWWSLMQKNHRNVMQIMYDDMKGDRVGTLNQVADKLGVPKRDHYSDFLERVGWMTVKEARTNEGRMT